LVFPCEAEPMHVVPIDLIERRVMALAEIASVRHPLLGLVVGIEEPLASDVAVALSGDRRARGGAARGRARGGIRCFAAASTEERKRQPQRYGQAMSRQGHVGPRRIELLSCSPARVPRGPRRLYPAAAAARSPTTAMPPSDFAHGQMHQSAAEAAISDSRWKRSIFGACCITPAVRQTNVMSSSGSTQKSVLPEP